MRFLFALGICLLACAALSERCGDWETLDVCSVRDKECNHPMVRKCSDDEGESHYETEYQPCDSSECGPGDLDWGDGEGEGDGEGDDDDDDDKALDSSEGPGPLKDSYEEEEKEGEEEEEEEEEDELDLDNSGKGPDDLNTGEEFCISGCSDEYSFVATYETGVALNEQKLCHNNLTATIGGRGGEGCRADDWFIVEECNEDCYEFGWRASYPSYCDVEDIWLWCCDPKVETRPATVCGDHDVQNVPCVVTAYKNILDSLTISWVDSEGNDLSEMAGFDVSRTYKVQDDKLLSVLSVNSWAVSGSSAVVTCQVSVGFDGDVTAEEPAEIVKFDVEVDSKYQRVGSDAFLTCTGVGTDSDDLGYSFSWYSWDELGNKLAIDEVADRRVVDGQWVSVLTIPEEIQRIGSQAFQCVLEHSRVDECGLVTSTEGDATGVLTVWDVTEDTYCAHPGDEAVLSFTVLGTNEYSTVDDGVIESLTKGTMITTETTFRDGFLMTISRNEDDELVVTLTISPNMTEEVGSEFFITYTKEEGKEGVEPNLELNVMELTGGAPVEGDLVEEDDDYVVVGVVEGGKMQNPIWRDDNGRIYRLGTTEDGVEVTLSDDMVTSTIRIPKDVVESQDLDEVTLHAGLYSETGTYCRRQQVVVNLLAEPQCLIRWDKAVCDERSSCSDYVQERTWSCFCGEEEAPKSECNEPDEILTFTCPATESYEVSDWEEEECDREECYPYAVSRERACFCVDADGSHTDSTGALCGNAALEEMIYCNATKPWVVGGWMDGECPTEACFPSETMDTRGCYCDGKNDRSRCGDEELVRVRDCPATRDFEWGPWGPEVCDLWDRCYPSTEVKTRSCTCRYYGQTVTDNSVCEGEREAVYSCDANLEWHPEEKGDPCEESDTESCSSFTAFQNYRCVCEHGDIMEVDDDPAQCDAEPTPVLCAANKAYEWSDWVAESECSVCYPELDQQMSRTCTCGDKEDATRCDGPAETSEECPAPRNRVWLPTEWTDIPCGDLSCRQETFTTRTRECECEGNKDNSRCEEDLTGVLSCGFAPFVLSEWSDDECDEQICHPYSKNKTRSCVCDDSDGTQAVDLEQCDAGEEGYSEEFDCEGDSYDWGEWQSRGCPESCFVTKTKRYRICSCHGDVDFNSCDGGNAIEFYDCPATKEC